MPGSDPARRRAVEQIIRSSIAYGWKVAHLSLGREVPESPIVEITWTPDGLPKIRTARS